MTDLRAAAERATPAIHVALPAAWHYNVRDEDFWPYVRAADPTTILAMLDERDRLREALRGLLHYFGEGRERMMLPERVKFRNGRVDEDRSSANIEHNECLADEVNRAHELLAAIEGKP
jgi:hypothetical protein